MLLAPDHKRISAIYLIFLASIFMNFIPSISVQTIGGFLFLGIFIYSYIVKYNSDKESFDRAHAQYIIKTIWIFSLFLLIALVLALVLGDHTVIDNAVNTIAQTGVVPSNDEMMKVLMEYSITNLILFSVLFIPTTFYLFYRLGKGLLTVRKGEKPSNPKSWF